jgi:hypothetical protein
VTANRKRPCNAAVPAGGYADCTVDGGEEQEHGACQALARRLEEELRAAKSAQLSCGEVLLPADLLPRIARDVLRMAENEPCGLRSVVRYHCINMPHSYPD